MKDKKGITLVALIVSIIIMLVLVGITVRLAIGNKGVIEKTGETNVEAIITRKKEEVQVAILEELTKYDGEKTRVKVSNVVENIRNYYSKQAEKDSITGQSIGETEDRFPGRIIYNPPASEIQQQIIITVDENFMLTAGTAEVGEEIEIPVEVTPEGSEIIEVSGIYYNSPDLTGFNPKNTYYVTYDSTGSNQTIVGRIDKISPNEENPYLVGNGTNNVWHDYANKIWANVVTVNGNDVAYWVWVPRYKYTVTNTSTKETDVRFVDNSDIYYTKVDGGPTPTDLSDDYILPESFKFGEYSGEGPDTRRNLSGIWICKYEVQESPNEGLDVTTSNGIKTLRTTKTSTDTYQIFVDGVEYLTGVTLPYSMTELTPGRSYDICVVNETQRQMIGKIPSDTSNITVNTSGFEPDKTYYVVYDENGNNETIAGRMDKIAEPENWYDYDRKIWANLVTVNGNDVTYWTYIPRFEYMTVTTSPQMSIVRFIPKTVINSTSEYSKIPDAFQFGKNKPLDGIWISKYEVQTDVENGIEKISYSVNGTYATITSNAPNGTYSIFLNGTLLESLVSLNEPYTIGMLGDEVDIMIYSETNKRVIGETHLNSHTIQIDLTGFDKDNTYYVLYDETGNYEFVTDIKVNYDEYGNPTNIPDRTLGVWYDYEMKIWANVVTKSNGEIAYWTYIPRFEYMIVTTSPQMSIVRFIPKSQEKPSDYHWKIPESFEFGYDNPLSGFWISKYEVQ